MTDAVVPELIKMGTLGVLLVAVAAAALFLFRELAKERAAHMASIKEHTKREGELHQGFQAREIELTRSALTAMAASANNIEAVNESVKEVKATLAEYNDLLRDSLTEPRRFPPRK